MGNPRFSACFLDEGLNIPLRDISQFVHRSRFEKRVFQMFNLFGLLKLNKYLFGQLSDSDSLGF